MHFDCPYYNDGFCRLKKRFGFKSQESLCQKEDQEDYKTFKSEYWFPAKKDLSYSSSCPLVSLRWFKNLKNPTQEKLSTASEPLAQITQAL